MTIVWRDFKKIVGVVPEIYKKALKVQISNEIALRWWENGLVFKIARTKKHQNFLASKYDIIKAAFWRYLRIIWVIYNVFIK